MFLKLNSKVLTVRWKKGYRILYSIVRGSLHNIGQVKYFDNFIHCYTNASTFRHFLIVRVKISAVSEGSLHGKEWKEFGLYYNWCTQSLTDIPPTHNWEETKVEKVEDMKMIPRDNVEASSLLNHLSIRLNTLNGNILGIIRKKQSFVW